MSIGSIYGLETAKYLIRIVLICFSGDLFLIFVYFLPYHPGGTIVSPGWNDRPTRVKRSMGNGMEAKTLSFNGFS